MCNHWFSNFGIKIKAMVTYYQVPIPYSEQLSCGHKLKYMQKIANQNEIDDCSHPHSQ